MHLLTKPVTAIWILPLLVFSLAASAATLLPLNLQQLSTRATLVFYGEVISNKTEKDEISGQIATFTEFEIIELIKGNAGSTHIIKQLGGHLADTGTTLRVHGVPQFVAGKKYVVFLPEESGLGFCSPLGLQQGSFAVSAINGENVVSTGHLLAERSVQNNSIQIPLAVRADNPAHVRLGDFINTVRAFNAP
jgi:hypothetical protein